jgi:hypothetical protein
MYRRLLVASAALALLSGVAHAETKSAKPPVAAQKPTNPIATAEALRDKALLDRTAWDITEDLTTSIGPRLVGSPAMARAKDWGVAKLKALGFTDVKVEQFAKPSWTRGEESAELVAPYPMKLSIVGLGRTVPTPPEGIEAEVAVFHTFAELVAAPESAVKGKIVLITQPMVRTQDASG